MLTVCRMTLSGCPSLKKIPAAFPYYRFVRKNFLPSHDRFVFHQGQQFLKRKLSDHLLGLSERGERRLAESRKIDVIEPNDGAVFGDTDSYVDEAVEDE